MTEQLRNLGQRIRSKKQDPQWAKSRLQAMKQRRAAELVRLSKIFDDEPMLVHKRQDFFGQRAKTLKRILAFLDSREPRAWTALDKGGYETMGLSTGRRLEDYFEPHNQRLYEYLGVDLDG